MRTAARLSACVALTALAAGSLQAQDAAPQEQPTPQSVADYRKELGKTAIAEAVVALNAVGAALVSSGSDDRAMAGFTAPKFTVTSEDGETAVSFAFSFDIGDDDPVIEEEPTDAKPATFYRVTQTRMSLVGSMPLEDDADISTLFRGDSLVRGYKAKLALSQLSNTLGDGTGAAFFVNRAYGECIPEQAKLWLGDNPGQDEIYAVFLSAVEKSAAETVQGTPRGRARALQRLASGKAEKSIEQTVHFACTPGDTKKGARYGDEGELVRAYTGLYSDFASRFYDNRSWLRFRGLDASVGQDDYTYLDRALFATPEEKRTSWEVGAYYGFINPTATFSARARVVYGRTWELPDEGEACEPAGDPPQEQCLTGPDGPPRKIETGLFSVETRHLFKFDDKRTIALAPQVTYRFEDDVVGVEVPVYLAPDANGDLTGGLKFGWSSDENEFGVGVFVGVAFPGVNF